jgi:NADH-quinone oxidoreductase subunit C
VSPERLGAVLGERPTHTAYGVTSVDLPREDWVAAVTAVRDDEELDGSFFDLLTAVDELDRGFTVVLRLWSPRHRSGVVLRTTCPRDDAWVPSLTGVFGGAAWHERSTAEMFAIAFPGHPDLAPLLLPDGFTGAPLRKDFLLAARLDKPWPGAKEPGESDADFAGGGTTRRRARPPGVPEPGAWGAP